MVDVVVRSAERLPDDAYLSLRMGSVRRQCLYKPGSRFAFDAVAAAATSQPKAVSIEVFQKVATAEVQLKDLPSTGAGAWRGDVEVPLAAGGSAKVALEITSGSQRGGDGGGDGAEKVGTKESTGGGGDAREREEAARKARGYLDNHALQQLLGRMMRGLLQVQPLDPLGYMRIYLEEISSNDFPTKDPSAAAHAAAAAAAAVGGRPPAETGRTELAAADGGADNSGARAEGDGSLGAAAADGAVGAGAGAEEGEGEGEGEGEEECEEEEEGEEEEDGFDPSGIEELPDLTNHHSLVAKVLRENPGLYEKHKDACTATGVTLARCIKTGVDVEGHSMIRMPGLCAGDAESFELFSEVFGPVLRDWFPDYSEVARHPLSTMGHPDALHDFSLDPTGDLAALIYFRLQRNLDGLPFPNACSWQERRDVEAALEGAFGALKGDLKGEYLPLRGSTSIERKPEGMSEDDEGCLFRDGMLPDEPDSETLIAAGFARSWPDARGVFRISEGLAAWVNELNHVELKCTQKGGDLQGAFGALSRFEGGLRQVLESGADGKRFAVHERWGFLSPSLPSLGTGLTVGTILALPKLSTRPEFPALCTKLGLKALKYHTSSMKRVDTGHARRHSLGKVWDLSRPSALGRSETDEVNHFLAACRLLVDLELALERQFVGTDEEAEARAQEALARAERLIGEGDGFVAAVAAEAREADAAAAATARPSTGTEGGLGGETDEESLARRRTAATECEKASAPVFMDIPGLGEEDVEGFRTEECPEELPDLSRHFSLVASAFKEDPDLYQRLREKRSSLGTSLARCIKPGIDNKGHPMIKTVGLVAGDAECYEIFDELFSRVLASASSTRSGCGGGAAPPSTTQAPPRSALEDCQRLPSNLQPAHEDEEDDGTGARILSVALRMQRNLEGLRWPPATTKEERRKVEDVLVSVLKKLQLDGAHEYFPLLGSQSAIAAASSSSAPSSSAGGGGGGGVGGMSPSDERRLEEASILFRAPEAPLELSSGSGRHWPDARGVFAASVGGGREGGEVAAWVNNEDHLCLWSRWSSADFAGALRLLLRVDEEVRSLLKEAGFQYAWSEQRGFLTSDPSCAGTALGAEVRLRLPRLNSAKGWRKLCANLGLAVLGSSDDEDDEVWRLASSAGGLAARQSGAAAPPSEVEQVLLVSQAVQTLLHLEAKLERGEAVDLSSAEAIAAAVATAADAA